MDNLNNLFNKFFQKTYINYNLINYDFNNIEYNKLIYHSCENQFINVLFFALLKDYQLNYQEWDFLIKKTNLLIRDSFKNNAFHYFLIRDKMKELNKNSISYLIDNIDFLQVNYLNKSVLELFFIFPNNLQYLTEDQLFNLIQKTNEEDCIKAIINLFLHSNDITENYFPYFSLNILQLFYNNFENVSYYNNHLLKLDNLNTKKYNLFIFYKEKLQNIKKIEEQKQFILNNITYKNKINNINIDKI